MYVYRKMHKKVSKYVYCTQYLCSTCMYSTITGSELQKLGLFLVRDVVYEDERC